LGRWRSALASKSANDAQRSSRLQSTNTGRAPALITESAVAMNVFAGQSTVPSATPQNSSAAIAAPDQLENATLGSPFQARQASSNLSTSSPSVHRSESSTSSQSSWRRARSRGSNPIAND